MKTYLFQSTKRVALLALCSFNMCAVPLLIDSRAVLCREESDITSIIKNQEEFFVVTGKGAKKVKSHDVSHELRKLNNDQLTTFLNNGHGVITTDQFTNGDFKLDMLVRGNGGGVVGAAVGVVVGQNLVRALTYGPIWIIAGFTGPAAPAVGTFLTGCAAPFVEPVALTTGAIAGMAGMAATGPI